jgi:hypothetical protein
MRRLFAAIALPLSLSALLVACGDGPDVVATPTPTIPASSATSGASATAPQTINPPTVPEGNIDAISPAHGARITQLESRTPADTRGGVCVQVNFDEAPEQFQWFRMVFDEEEVTVSPDTLLLLPSNAQQVQPEGGTMCYAPEAGFAPGIHTVTVAVQNPRNPGEPTRQIVQWQFEVTE